MMSTDEALIRFKSDAWKSTGMVAGYAEKMHENRGTNRLKNEVEVSLCRQYAQGGRIIDVGIGTGRGSLPLAREGRSVTGVDISQAMLNQCRREAGQTPVELLEGDLTHLPVGDEQFDTLLSLNVAVHFPNWREALSDWARVVKPGGRLIFDVHSRDHLDAVALARGCAPADLLTEAQRNDPMHFMLRLTATEVAQAARDHQLSVVRLIPYAAVLGGGNVNYWLRDSRLWGYLGDRALSWMAQDERIHAFGRFLEREVFGELSTACTGRFMIVLEKHGDDRATQAAIAHNDAVNAVLSSTPRLTELQRIVCGANAWPSQLREHLEYDRNGALLAMALSGPLGERLRAIVEDLAGSEVAELIYDANQRQRVDDDVYAFAQSWYREVTTPEQFMYEGVNLGPVFEYDLMKNVLLAEYFGKKSS